MDLLKVTSLAVRYGAVLGVQDVTVDVPEGHAVALLGANGAGKTTTLRAISGLLPYHRGKRTSGDIQFAGRPIAAMAPEQLVRAGMAQALEGRRVFGDLTVIENLEVGAFAVPRARRDARRKKHVFELFPRLAERADQLAGTMSGGEQQMLAIGRALMAQPRLVLLDEPSLGLAPMVVGEIADAIRQIVAEGTSVLLVDQNTDLALEATTSAYLIENGCTTASGSTAKLLADPEVRAAYLGADIAEPAAPAREARHEPTAARETAQSSSGGREW